MKRLKKNTVIIPVDFPHPQRLGGRDLFLAVLGYPASSTFARWLAEGKVPKPRKMGSLNRWPETQMAKVRDEGVADDEIGRDAEPVTPELRNMRLANGKRLQDCTFGELRKLLPITWRFLAIVATRGKKDQLVGKVYSEVDLQKAFSESAEES